MVELRQRYKFTLLHFTFGLLKERPSLSRKHIIGTHSFFRLDNYRTPMLLYRSSHAFKVSDSQTLRSPMLAPAFR
jgi:hypothetical protein